VSGTTSWRGGSSSLPSMWRHLLLCFNFLFVFCAGTHFKFWMNQSLNSSLPKWLKACLFPECKRTSAFLIHPKKCSTTKIVAWMYVI
jgi:hypothetical protein